LDNLIRAYEGALSDQQCDYLVEMFERYSALQEKQTNANGQTLTRINLMASKYSPFKEDLDYLSNVFTRAVRKYKDDLDLQQFQFPSKFSLEAMKIKRYEKGGKDSFPFHIDVNDLETSKRFLVMFIYLTDNEKGETTLDVKYDLFVSPCKKGTILSFPPYWPWVHQGEKPINESKYILGSYLHYVE